MYQLNAIYAQINTGGSFAHLFIIIWQVQLLLLRRLTKQLLTEAGAIADVQRERERERGRWAEGRTL